MNCRFYNNMDNSCSLLSKVFDSPHFVNKIWCEKDCSDIDDKTKKTMLSRWGVHVDTIPETIDALDLKRVVFSEHGEIHRKNCLKVGRKFSGNSKEINSAVASLPTKYQLVKNLGKHAITIAKHYKQTGRIKVTEFHRQARLDICEACDKSKEVDGSLRCTLKSCGCHLTGDLGRVAFEALPCPIDKHKQIDLEYKE